jgi:ribosomal 50S subunit-associated protein YjgA (DUF615 family)
MPGICLSGKADNEIVRSELRRLKAELAGLAKTDWARKSPLESQIQKLQNYLRQVENHRGQARKVKGGAQRARTAVTNAINRAIATVSAEHPDMGLHLKGSIKTGTTVIYVPADLPDWQF